MGKKDTFPRGGDHQNPLLSDGGGNEEKKGLIYQRKRTVQAGPRGGRTHGLNDPGSRGVTWPFFPRRKEHGKAFWRGGREGGKIRFREENEKFP